MAAVHYASPQGKYNDRDAAEEWRLFNAGVASTHAAYRMAPIANDDPVIMSWDNWVQAEGRVWEWLWENSWILRLDDLSR